MRSVTVYLAIVFLGGALLAPWLYEAAQQLAAAFPLADSLARYPFPRYVNRSFLIIAVLGLWPFLRANQLWSVRSLGLQPSRIAWRELGKGLLVGFASLAVVAVFALVVGPADLDLRRGMAGLARRIGRAAASASAVGVLEEIVFRAALFGALRKRFTWQFALALSSLIYAAVHFLQRATPSDSIGWDSGFAVLGQMLAGFRHAGEIFPALLSLMVAGAILGLSYQRSGRLYMAIGIHVGWIFWLQTNAAVTTRPTDSATWFWGTEKLIDGWFAFLILLGLGLAGRLWMPATSERQG